MGGSFPQGSHVIAELEVGDLDAGVSVWKNFSLDEPAGFLLVGYRTGAFDGLQVTLRGPDGHVWDTDGADPAGPCAVRAPARGAWSLEVHADAFDGALHGGKFTVRAHPGDPPPLVTCIDEAFPAKGRLVTLALATRSLGAGDNASGPPSGALRFDEPFDLAQLRFAVRFEAPAPAAIGADNASDANTTGAVVPSNLTAADFNLAWQAPDNATREGLTVEAPLPQGAWELRWSLRPPAEVPAGNLTVAVRGKGS